MRATLWENKHGVIVGDEKGILEVWADNLKELPNALGKGIIPEKKVCLGPEQDIRAPSKQEFPAVKENLRIIGLNASGVC